MGRDDQQGQVAGTYLAEKFKGKKIAVVDDKSAYGKGLADEVAKAMEAKGVKPALRESITAGEKDYSGLVSKLKSSGVEVMAYGGYHTEVALILRQAQQAGLKLTVMGGDTMSNTELATAAGPRPNNVLFTFGPDARKNPSAAAVVKKFHDAKVEPEGYVLYAYAAFQLFDQAATKAKSTKYADIEKALRSGTFDTVIGKLSFDAKGEQFGAGLRRLPVEGWQVRLREEVIAGRAVRRGTRPPTGDGAAAATPRRQRRPPPSGGPMNPARHLVSTPNRRKTA
jgi:branched-chain amino acid transport system substrate-binding protein